MWLIRRFSSPNWLLLLVLLPWLEGCSMTSYLLHIASGEARILLSRRSIDDELERKNLDPRKREQLLLIKQTAEDAQHLLHLDRDHQYREVSRLDDAFNVWVLALAEPDELTAVTWRFPIAGEVPYLGFFSRKRAASMAEKHYPEKDHYIRTAAGFSTLGYLPDPVLPAFFDLADESMVNLIVHELVHATLYVPGNSSWNETVATALGNAGTVVLLKAWGREDLLVRAEQRFADNRLWAVLVSNTIAQMREAYAGVTSPTRRLADKERLVAAFKTRIREAPWHNTRYTSYADEDINHAFLLANEVYLTNPDFQNRVYEQAVADFAGTVHKLRCLVDTQPGDLWRLPDTSCGAS